jgi:WXXGXW repeat (2 copies)
MPAAVAGNPAKVIVTTGTPGGTTTIVNEAPPALQTDVVLTQPGLNYVWIQGYWTLRSDQYQWVAGHWELPPTPGSVWTPPTLEPQGNAYKFTEGYWN